ncbi:MAG: hypothetical protein KC543_12435 [Myxococcales bacterium]|nr:hypothetical protein [Myxococcales bacterium]
MTRSAWTLGLALSIGAASAARPCPALAQVSRVAVLGLSSEAIDPATARDVTNALRHAATLVPEWRVHQGAVSLAQMVVLEGCAKPDLACLGAIAKDLGVDQLVIGRIRARPAAPAQATRPGDGDGRERATESAPKRGSGSESGEAAPEPGRAPAPRGYDVHLALFDAASGRCVRELDAHLPPNATGLDALRGPAREWILQLSRPLPFPETKAPD